MVKRIAKVVHFQCNNQINERLDAIYILLKNNSRNSAKSINRDLFENVLYFCFVIDSKQYYKTRALSYYYSNINDQINMSKLLISKNEVGIKIRKFLNVKSNEEQLIGNAKKSNEYFSRKLNDDVYNNIKIEWDRFVKKKKTKYPRWYSLFNGPKNIKQLAKKCDYEVEYELLYRIYSRQVHSLNVMEQFENINGLAGIKALRTCEDSTLELMFSFDLGFDSLNKFVDFFKINHKVNMKDWYNSIYT